MTTANKVYSIDDLKKKGHCVRPEKGVVGRKMNAAIAKLFENEQGHVVLDFVSSGGAAVYLRKLRDQDFEKYGDVGLGVKDGHPAIFLHGCIASMERVGQIGRAFIRQNEMRKVLVDLLPEAGLTVAQDQAVKMRFGVEPYYPGRSMEQTAAALNVTRARVGQILLQALKRLGFEPRWRLA